MLEFLQSGEARPTVCLWTKERSFRSRDAGLMYAQDHLAQYMTGRQTLVGFRGLRERIFCGNGHSQFRGGDGSI